MYSFIQDVPITEDLHEKIRSKLGPDPLDGLIVHVVLRRENGMLRYVDVWRDKQSCDAAFAQRIHPAVVAVFREVGFKPAGEPTREEMPAVDVWLGRA